MPVVISLLNSFTGVAAALGGQDDVGLAGILRRHGIHVHLEFLDALQARLPSHGAAGVNRLGERGAIQADVVSAGSFDLMAEVVVADDGALLDLTNRIRAVPGVRNTETFIYLDLVKQTFTWGAH